MMITSLSLAVVPMTSSGAAFSPSGSRCGVGLSMTLTTLACTVEDDDDGGGPSALLTPSDSAAEAGSPVRLALNVILRRRT